MKDYTAPQQLGPQTPESELRIKPKVRYALRYRTRVLPLQGRSLVVGRLPECDIVLTSPMVSRRHARITVDARGVVIEDLGSRNGVVVNGTIVSGPARLEPGAWIGIGDDAFELMAVTPEPVPGGLDPINRSLDRISKPTLSASSASPEPADDGEHTRSANVFDLLGGTVERALAAGNAEEAERVLGGHLERLVRDARTERHHELSIHGRAALYAIRIAVGTRKARWFDYVLRLYFELGQPLPLPVVDQLCANLRRIPDVNRLLLRDYVACLRMGAARMSPEERFMLQRVEALERLVSVGQSSLS